MAKTDRPPALSPVQLEIMNVVWDRGDATVSDVWRALLADRKISRGSVQTMVLRLEEKGWLRHREVGQAFLFTAVFPREATQKRLVTDLADRAFSGSAEGLIWSLLECRGISKAEAQRLRAMIDKAERNRKKGRK